jgi:anti-anti-sigma factor
VQEVGAVALVDNPTASFTAWVRPTADPEHGAEPQPDQGRASMTVVEVAGEFDRGACAGFRVLMRDYIGDRQVALDLSRCLSIDVVAVGALVGAVRRIREAGGDAWIFDVQDQVIDTLHAAGADDFLRSAPPGGQG